jgi:Na+/phosphate symporter
MLKELKATKEEIKRREREKRMAAIERLGELLEKTGATSEENIKIIREVREEN